MSDPKWDETEEIIDVPKFEDTEELTPEESSPVEAYGAGLFQDLSFGLIDELKGGLEAGGQAIGVKGLGKEFGQQEFQEPIGMDLEKLLEVYREGRGTERERQEKLSEESPTAYSAGEWTGTVAPIIATGAGAAAKKLLTTGGKEIAEKGLKEGAEALIKDTGAEGMKKLAKTGAGFGALGSAGYSETDALQDPMQMAKEVATGAGLGATIGVAAPEAIKLTAKGVKKVGGGLKKGSKAIFRLMAGLEEKTLDEMIEKSDDLQKVIHYPEVAEKVREKSEKVHSNIGRLAESGKKMLDDKKTVPKQDIVTVIKNKLEEAKSKISKKSAVPKLEEILDKANPKTQKQATQEAAEKLNKRASKMKLEGQDVVKAQKIQEEKARQQLQDKLDKAVREAEELGMEPRFSEIQQKDDILFVKLEGQDAVKAQEMQKQKAYRELENKMQMAKREAEELGETINFTNITEKDGIITALDTRGKVLKQRIKPAVEVKPKLIQQKIPRVKSAPKFSEPRLDPETGLMFIRNLDTDEAITQEIEKVILRDDTYTGELVSLQDLHEFVKDVGKTIYDKDIDNEGQKVLRSLYYELSESLKDVAPKEYRQIAKEMADRYALLAKLEEKLGIKIDYNVAKIESQDKLISKLQQVGKETEGYQKTDIEKLLADLQETQGKEVGEKSLEETLKLKKLQTELDTKPTDFSYQVRTVLGSVVGGLAGGPVGGAVGVMGGLVARPMAREMIKKGKLKNLSMLPSIAKKITDKTAEVSAPFVLGKSIKEGSKSVEEMAEYDYLEQLIGDLEASERPASQELAGIVKGLHSEDSQERAKSELEYATNPAARQAVEKHRKEYDKGRKPASNKETTSPYSVDHDFMKETEGMENTGYIPATGGNITQGSNVDNPIMGASGVTIASGYDLGQQKLSSLKALKLPKELENKLKPFLGLKKKQASDKLQEIGLEIEEDQAKLIQERVDKYYERRAKVDFERKSGKVKFKDLPPAVQTIIYSLNYHIGQTGPATIKKAVDGVKTGVWEPFIEEVENWHGDGQDVPQWKKDRRKKEANYLRDYLKKYNETFNTGDYLQPM